MYVENASGERLKPLATVKLELSFLNNSTGESIEALTQEYLGKLKDLGLFETEILVNNKLLNKKDTLRRTTKTLQLFPRR